MKNSKIEWTDHTFNPWIGCTKVSPGCQYCYAETFGKRFDIKWGPQGERRRTSGANRRQPLAWNRKHWMQCLDCGTRFQSNTDNVSHAICDDCGSRNIEPTRARVFCASLADVFEERSELVEWRIELFGLIRATPTLDWLVLTKRPENIDQFLYGPEHGAILGGGDWLGNLWLGTSVEDQESANRRLPPLLAAEAGRVKFLSCEPLLGPIDLTAIRPVKGVDYQFNALSVIDWVICGGESGPHARPMHPDWVQSLRDQCLTNGTPFFFKQWGEWFPSNQYGSWAYRVGKKAAGRLLDGVQWDQYPTRNTDNNTMPTSQKANVRQANLHT